MPIVARTRLGLAAARRGLAAPVVLVPTMGALHDGHRALIRRAREIASPNGSVVVSVFVNPLQFGAGEDLDGYPRTLRDDVLIVAEEGGDLLFAPNAAQMYPRPQLITVDPGRSAASWRGSRPGHFAGVLTVVASCSSWSAGRGGVRREGLIVAVLAPAAKASERNPARGTPRRWGTLRSARPGSRSA